MFGKVILFICIVGISNAVLIDTLENNNKDLIKTNPHAWQMVKVYHPPPQAIEYKYEPYAYPKYEFEYSVSDKKTGDHKHHHEARDGDKVRGEYSLVESDGSLRKVQYHADDHSGFNAVVSKTVNKHGDHAVSVSDHTRFFYPIGHNVKINHYFPGKDYHYQDMEKPENNKISIPVHEVTAPAAGDDAKTPLNESKITESVKLEEQTEESMPKESVHVVVPTPKAETIESVPVEVVPAIVSVIPSNTEVNNINAEAVSSAPETEKSDNVPSIELTSVDENQKLEKVEQSDSEVASSYYHSKFYFIGY